MKKRLDLLLVERGLCGSRTRAQALVMEGKVRVDGQVELKAARPVDAGASVEVEAPPRFVSRGGEKLQGAFELWGTGNGERGCVPKGRSASTSAPRRAASPTACCSTAPRA